MNEQRINKQKYLNNELTTELDNSWDGLNSRLVLLKNKASALGNASLILIITNTQNVIKRNKPNKKLYRTVQKRIKDIEILIANLEKLHQRHIER